MIWIDLYLEADGFEFKTCLLESKTFDVRDFGLRTLSTRGVDHQPNADPKDC